MRSILKILTFLFLSFSFSYCVTFPVHDQISHEKFTRDIYYSEMYNDKIFYRVSYEDNTIVVTTHNYDPENHDPFHTVNFKIGRDGIVCFDYDVEYSLNEAYFGLSHADFGSFTFPDYVFTQFLGKFDNTFNAYGNNVYCYSYDRYIDKHRYTCPIDKHFNLDTYKCESCPEGTYIDSKTNKCVSDCSKITNQNLRFECYCKKNEMGSYSFIDEAVNSTDGFKDIVNFGDITPYDCQVNCSNGFLKFGDGSGYDLDCYNSEKGFSEFSPGGTGDGDKPVDPGEGHHYPADDPFKPSVDPGSSGSGSDPVNPSVDPSESGDGSGENPIDGEESIDENLGFNDMSDNGADSYNNDTKELKESDEVFKDNSDNFLDDIKKYLTEFKSSIDNLINAVKNPLTPIKSSNVKSCPFNDRITFYKNYSFDFNFDVCDFLQSISNITYLVFYAFFIFSFIRILYWTILGVI